MSDIVRWMHDDNVFSLNLLRVTDGRRDRIGRERECGSSHCKTHERTHLELKDTEDRRTMLIVDAK
jgi:hypothetical protein